MPNDVLIMEGKTDFYFMNYFQKKYDIKNVSVFPGSGATSSDVLISLSLGFGRNFLVLSDDDKAGREGFIDNVAAKTLKLLIENILMTAARDHFGSDADLRKEKLPEVQAINKESKANLERNKLRKKQRSQFKKNLRNLTTSLPNFTEQLTSF